jgi:phage gp36-like protein
MVLGEGILEKGCCDCFRYSLNKNETDEYVEPTVIG